MHISAKADYAVRALLALAAQPDGQTMTGEAIARTQNLPTKFLENILVDLRRGGFVHSQRGHDGGYRLARPAQEITPAEVIRVLDGPLAEVRGLRPEATDYTGPAAGLQDVWIAARASLRKVLDEVTLADIVGGKLPRHIKALTADPEAWKAR